MFLWGLATQPHHELNKARYWVNCLMYMGQGWQQDAQNVMHFMKQMTHQAVTFQIILRLEVGNWKFVNRQQCAILSFTLYEFMLVVP